MERERESLSEEMNSEQKWERCNGEYWRIGARTHNGGIMRCG